MTDSDEEDKIGDIDAPEDGSGQTGDAKPLTILVDVGIHTPKDDSHEDAEGGIESLPRFPDRFKEDGILFQIEMLLFHYIPSER